MIRLPNGQEISLADVESYIHDLEQSAKMDAGAIADVVAEARSELAKTIALNALNAYHKVSGSFSAIDHFLESLFVGAEAHVVKAVEDFLAEGKITPSPQPEAPSADPSPPLTEASPAPVAASEPPAEATAVPKPEAAAPSELVLDPSLAGAQAAAKAASAVEMSSVVLPDVAPASPAPSEADDKPPMVHINGQPQ